MATLRIQRATLARISLVGCCLYLLAGCVTSVSRPSAVTSYAPFAGVTADTWWGRLVRRQLAAPDIGQACPVVAPAGFRLLPGGPEALAARLSLIDHAAHSLDLQYYIFKGDTSGALVADRLLAAADRGVRIRLLLDDIGTRLGEIPVIRLAAHPLIEIRLFNPLTLRTRWLAPLSQIGEFARVNYRMHNKLIVADNQVMITGGRNIGDEYFGFRALDFQDLDVIGLGEIAVQASVSFDDYWNSYLSVPVEDIVPRRVTAKRLSRLRGRLQAGRAAPAWQQLETSAAASGFSASLEAGELAWFAGPFRWLSDPAAKADPTSTRLGEPVLGRALLERLPEISSELLVITPYFIPGTPRTLGLDRIASLRARGVAVRVLTNSLASTDVIAVHSSYARYRVPLLKNGVELWELRDVAGQADRAHTFRGRSLASLHAKTFVHDRRWVFIGSVNLDPRSMNLNTESGVLLDQPALAAQVVALFDGWTAPGNAWQLGLGSSGQLQWEDDAGTAAKGHEPGASWSRRVLSALLGLLPIESQM